MMSENYTAVDIIATIMTFLKKKHGITFENELKKSLQKKYKEISTRELNSILMKMETQGLVYVSGDDIGKRQIRLLENMI